MEKSQAQDESEAKNTATHTDVKRILVPVDFSPQSRSAVRFARAWAERFGSEVCLLHVIEPENSFDALGIEPISLLVPPPDFDDQVRNELELLAHQEFADSCKVSVHLRDGPSADQIAVAARKLKADLIIIATSGRTGLEHVPLGSTAESVVRHASCPVHTLRCAG